MSVSTQQGPASTVEAVPQAAPSDKLELLTDPFLDNYYESQFRSYLSLAEGGPDGTAMNPVPQNGEVEVHDILQRADSSGRSWERRISVLSFTELERAVEPTCKIRIIFLAAMWHYTKERLLLLAHHFNIPSAFWGEEGSGFVGQRFSVSEAFGRTTDFWMIMMLKKFQDDQYAWGSPRSWGIQKSSFFLKQSDRSCDQGPAVTPTILICLNAPQYFRNRIYQALHHGGRSSNQSISNLFSDPYRLFLMVIMVWISWNTDLFWELRNNVLALESANTKSDIFRKPEYAYMHILSKDMIQAIELQEKAVKDVAYMRQLYVHRDQDENDQDSTDRRKQTISALDHQMNRFESVLARTNGLLKRMDNQISLTFNLVQQQDANASQRSSESVATISILTLLFLPGTAIGTIFATPFFHPSDSGAKLEVSPSFAYYWAFTIPVTALVVFIWILWCRISQALERLTSASLRQILSSDQQGRKRGANSNHTDPEQLIEMSDRPQSPHFFQHELNLPKPEGWINPDREGGA